MRLGAWTLCLSLATPAVAGDFRLDLPIDCIVGETCHIQQYVDHDPGPGALDYLCQGLSYNTHKGTDFALPYLRDIADDVDVLAAADGVVRAARDGMADRLFDRETGQAVDGKECGNRVVLRHADGWETQYCHLKRGSITVRKGQRVKAGTPLGHVGLSGRTQFPHLHLSVRQNGAVVDPFAPDVSQTCAPAEHTLWTEQPSYQPGGLIGVGFNAAVPDYGDVKLGVADQSPLPRDAPALVFWAYAFGSQPGDFLRLSVKGPAGFAFDQKIELTRQQAQFFRAAGKRLKEDRWPSGIYSGTAELIREKQIIDRKDLRMSLD